MRHLQLCALAALVLVLGSLPWLAGQERKEADEVLLDKYKVPTDGAGLLEFFRKRTLDDVKLEQLKKLIEQLGDDSFEKREEATKALIGLGLLARPTLQKGLKDPDLEVRRRCEACLKAIETEAGPRLDVTAAAVRVLKGKRPAGALAVLYSYLPSAEDERVAEEVRQAVGELALKDGKPDPVLVAGLKDRQAVKRAAAGVCLCRAGASELLPQVRKLLDDPETTVRLPVALALAALKEKDSVPVMIALLDQLPARELGRVEELLCRLAGEKAPPFPADSPAEWKKYRTAWEDWWKEHQAKLEPAVLGETAATLGNTTVVLLDKGTVIDLDSSNRPRWEVSGLELPLDVQRLAGDHVLVAEHKANRVTERNSKGEVVWEKKCEQPLAAQRLADGNTFIALRDGLLEVDKTGKEVFTYSRPAGEWIMRARKLPGGDIALITQLGVAQYVRLDRNGREVKRFGVEVSTSGGRIDVTPSGNVLIPEMNNNRIVERDQTGKVVRETPVQQPITANYLPNGHLLITSMTQNRAVELDRSGKEVWEYRRDTRVTRAVRP